MDSKFGLTVALAAAVHDLAQHPLQDDVRRAAERFLVNVLGTAVGASRDPAVDLLVGQAIDVSGSGDSAVVGRTERLTLLDAVTVNGFAAHLDDFDDTHLPTVIHPSAAAMSAMLGVSEARSATGEQALSAFAWGCEIQLRVGRAMSPEHYDDGWHITGTCAPIGGAVAAGLLFGLDPIALAHAIGLAASQTLGQREGFGTMVKPFHPGKGAANGVHAALLAEQGFTAPTDALEDPRGYFSVLSPRGHRGASVIDDLGSRFELLDNTVKPYPCGVVIHPLIDAGIELAHHVNDVHDIREIIATVHPLVIELTGEMNPTTGLEGRFSAAHGLAVGITDGASGLAQYRDESVRGEDVAAVRRKITFVVDQSFGRDQTQVRLVQVDDSVHEVTVEHARGSSHRPLSDEELQAKVRGLTEPILGDRTSDIFEQVECLTRSTDLTKLLEVVTGQPEVRR